MCVEVPPIVGTSAAVVGVLSAFFVEPQNRTDVEATKGERTSAVQCAPRLSASRPAPGSTRRSGSERYVGVVARLEALSKAIDAGLDLVEISPDATPPVAKIMDYGKFKYQEQKKAAEARKKQKVVEVKEIKMRPAIDDHDYETKLKAMRRFFEEGDKVKITLRFRGREMAHTDLGMQVLQRVKSDTEGIAKVEFEPKFEGRNQMIMILAPK